MAVCDEESWARLLAFIALQTPSAKSESVCTKVTMQCSYRTVLLDCFLFSEESSAFRAKLKSGMGVMT